MKEERGMVTEVELSEGVRQPQVQGMKTSTEYMVVRLPHGTGNDTFRMDSTSHSSLAGRDECQGRYVPSRGSP